MNCTITRATAPAPPCAYYLAWCWGGIHLLDGLIAGAVLGAVVSKR